MGYYLSIERRKSYHLGQHGCTWRTLTLSEIWQRKTNTVRSNLYVSKKGEHTEVEARVMIKRVQYRENRKIFVRGYKLLVIR